ncbi:MULTISPECIES: hypothetical protein [Nostocales]|uniref:Uncharacterized protein n=1 Tax=Tolypothrix bouteillei VB521301 TaxID=1479485 RepID=A0A0C1NB77_9CYAN
MKLKNHVAKKAKRLQNAMNANFGLSTEFLIKCMQNDRESLKLLGQMGREGALISKLAPRVREAAMNTIKGTEDLNVAIANIVTQSASSSLNIGKALTDQVLAQQSYQNQRQEIAIDFTNSRDIERLRHSLAVDYLKLQAWIDTNLMTVDGNAQKLEQLNRPEFKQLDADLRYQEKVAEHYLKYGDAERADLIPQRNYLPGGEGGFGDLIGRLKRAVLGF